MEGRVIAIRVTDAEFAALEEVKKREGLSWNQLLLGPVSDAHGLELPSAELKVKPAEEEKPASKPKTKKAHKAESAEEVIGDPPPPPEDVPGE